MGLLRRWRDALDRELSASVDDLTEWFDKAADAAMLEPGVPALPECVQDRIPVQREKPRDIMGGAQ